MSHLIEAYLQDAIATISWELDDDAFPDAFTSEIRLLAGLEFEQTFTEATDRFSPFNQ